MKRDEIVAEIRKIRDERAAKFGYDVEAMARDIKTREGKDGSPVVSRPAKRVTPREA